MQAFSEMRHCDHCSNSADSFMNHSIEAEFFLINLHTHNAQWKNKFLFISMELHSI